MPIVATLLGTLLLDERLGTRHLGGVALIAAGLGVVDGRLVMALRRTWCILGAPWSSGPTSGSRGTSAASPSSSSRAGPGS